MKHAAGWLLTALLGLLAIESAAQPALPEQIDLAELLRLVREASPRLAADRQAIAAAEANVAIAGALPNPTVSYGRYSPTHGPATLFEGSRQEQGTLELPLLLPGQRTARIDKAERELDAARARVASGASSLAAETGAAFVALLAAQERASLIAAASSELERLREIVSGRQASGVASRYDVLRIELELAGLRTKADVALAEVADRSGTLAALLGFREWRPRAAGTLAPLPAEAIASGASANPEQQSAAVVLANREEAAAKSGVELAQRERWPIPSLSAGRSWTTAPHGAANFLGVSVEVLLFDDKRAQVARAEAEARAASLRRELATAEVAANLARLANVIATREAALQRFTRDVSARLDTLNTMAEDSYRLGRTSIFELLDSMRSRHEMRQTRIELLAGLAEAQLRYLALRGDLEPRIAATAR